MEIGIITGIIIAIVTFIVLEVFEFKYPEAKTFWGFVWINLAYVFGSAFFGLVGGVITYGFTEGFGNIGALYLWGSIGGFLLLKLILYPFYTKARKRIQAEERSKKRAKTLKAKKKTTKKKVTKKKVTKKKGAKK